MGQLFDMLYPSREGLLDMFKKKEEMKLRDIEYLYLYTHFYSKSSWNEIVNFYKTYEALCMPIVNKYKNMDPGKKEFTSMYKEVEAVLPKLKAKSVSLRNKTIAIASKVLDVPKDLWIYGMTLNKDGNITDCYYEIINTYDDNTQDFDQKHNVIVKDLSKDEKIKLLKEALGKCKDLIDPEDHSDVLPKSFAKLVNDYEDDKFSDSFGEDCIGTLFYSIIDQGRYPRDFSVSNELIEHDIKKHLEVLTGESYFN